MRIKSLAPSHNELIDWVFLFYCLLDLLGWEGHHALVNKSVIFCPSPRFSLSPVTLLYHFLLLYYFNHSFSPFTFPLSPFLSHFSSLTFPPSCSSLTSPLLFLSLFSLFSLYSPTFSPNSQCTTQGQIQDLVKGDANILSIFANKVQWSCTNKVSPKQGLK